MKTPERNDRYGQTCAPGGVRGRADRGFWRGFSKSVTSQHCRGQSSDRRRPSSRDIAQPFRNTTPFKIHCSIRVCPGWLTQPFLAIRARPAEPDPRPTGSSCPRGPLGTGTMPDADEKRQKTIYQCGKLWRNVANNMSAFVVTAWAPQFARAKRRGLFSLLVSDSSCRGRRGYSGTCRPAEKKQKKKKKRKEKKEVRASLFRSAVFQSFDRNQASGRRKLLAAISRRSKARAAGKEPGALTRLPCAMIAADMRPFRIGPPLCRRADAGPKGRKRGACASGGGSTSLGRLFEPKIGAVYSALKGLLPNRKERPRTGS